MNPITPAELAAYFDHTQLRAYAQRGDFEKLCAEAREYGFAMVAINPAPVSLCKELLAGTSVHVGAAVGFPLGQSTPQVKKYETVDAIANGADEIDYVINITQLKEKNYDFIEHEMAGIVEECRGAGVISKVIFENCYLTEEEKRALCSIAREVRPDFIKTSTGFGTGGATFEDVALMKKCVGRFAHDRAGRIPHRLHSQRKHCRRTETQVIKSAGDAQNGLNCRKQISTTKFNLVVLIVLLTFFFCFITFCNIIQQRHIFQAVGGLFYRVCGIFQIRPAFTFRHRTFVHTSVQNFFP